MAWARPKRWQPAPVPSHIFVGFCYLQTQLPSVSSRRGYERVYWRTTGLQWVHSAVVVRHHRANRRVLTPLRSPRCASLEGDGMAPGCDDCVVVFFCSVEGIIVLFSHRQAQLGCKYSLTPLPSMRSVCPRPPHFLPMDYRYFPLSTNDGPLIRCVLMRPCPFGPSGCLVHMMLIYRLHVALLYPMADI